MADLSLAEILEITKDGEWGQGEPSADTTPMLVIRGTDFGAVRRGDISSVPVRHISTPIAERKRLQPGDILIETAGGTKDQPTGRTVFLKETLFQNSTLPITCASFSRFLRVKRDLIRPEYLFWYLQYLYGSGEMYPYHVQHTGVARFQYTQFANAILIPRPSFSIQDDVIEFLGALDDKIESNRQLNETLEAIAQTLFRDWFVDFGPTRAKMEGRALYLAADLWEQFPERLDATGLPEGWTRSTLGIDFSLTMGQSPPGDTYNEEGVGLPFFQGRTDFGFRYPMRRMFCSAPTRVAQLDDTLVSVRAPVGDLNLAWEPCCIGRGIAAVRHKSGSRSFTYYTMDVLQPALRAYEQTGTVFGAINKQQFEALETLQPSADCVTSFETTVAPLDERIRANSSEIDTLIALRDLLLPRLMSGEVGIRATETQVGEAL